MTQKEKISKIIEALRLMTLRMKKTYERIFKQHSVLVDVIHYLDSTKQSNTKIREAVDVILNHSDELHEASNREIELVQIKKRAGLV